MTEMEFQWHILTALKNTTLFGKLKDTLRQEKNSGLLQKRTNGKVMELCSSACLWVIVLLMIYQLHSFYLTRYFSFQVSYKEQHEKERDL